MKNLRSSLSAIVFLISTISLANENSRSDTHTSSDWDTQLHLSALGSFDIKNVHNDSLINPENSQYQFDNQNLSSELRPDLLGHYKEKYNFVIRPRARISLGSRTLSNATDTHVDPDFWLQEAQIGFQANSQLDAKIGRQNYQWGPAELASPSNYFFPVMSFNFSPTFEHRGVPLLKVSFTPEQTINVVAMSDIPFFKDDSFHSIKYPETQYHWRFAFKGELTSDDSRTLMGFIVGRDSHRNWLTQENEGSFALGNYFQSALSDEIQIYADYKAVQRSAIPIAGSSTVRESGPCLDLIAGARITPSPQLEIRNEYLYLGSGTNAHETGLTKILLKNPTSGPVLREEIFQNQTTLFRKNYLYSSARLNKSENFYGLKQPVVSIRNLYSFDDHSGLISPLLESGLTENTSLSLYFAVTYLGETGENLKVLNNFAGLGVKVSL